MGEARRADLASVRPVGTVRDEVNTHLALGRFDGAVCLAWRNGVAFAEDLLDGDR